MADSEVKWYGDDLLAKLTGANDDALYEGGEALLEMARSRAPERTGRLKRSGYVSSAKRSSYVKQPGYKKERKPAGPGVVAVGFAARHSHLVEFGTRKMAAQPFLRPALDEAKAAIGERIVIRLAKDLT